MEFLSEIYEKFMVSFVVEDRWKFFLDGFNMTLLLTFASFLGGSVLGAVFCALKFIKVKFIRKIVNIFTSFLIQIPTLVLLMVFVYMLFSDTDLSVVVVVTFGLLLKCGAYMADIFYSAVSGVNSGEAEAARTLGMSKLQTFINITFPQALDSSLPLYQNQFVITLQETSLVGSLAVQDLTKASSIVTSRTLDAFFGLFLISALYLLIGFVCTRLLSLLRNKKHLGGDESND